jgi:hypothetical protein
MASLTATVEVDVKNMGPVQGALPALIAALQKISELPSHRQDECGVVAQAALDELADRLR